MCSLKANLWKQPGPMHWCCLRCCNHQSSPLLISENNLDQLRYLWQSRPGSYHQLQLWLGLWQKRLKGKIRKYMTSSIIITSAFSKSVAEKAFFSMMIKPLRTYRCTTTQSNLRRREGRGNSQTLESGPGAYLFLGSLKTWRTLTFVAGVSSFLGSLKIWASFFESPLKTFCCFEWPWSILIFGFPSKLEE